MTDPTLPGPWAADEAPGPTCNLGETRALDLAHGAQLDDVGTKLGLKREWETDVVYRERIRRVANAPREAPCSLLPAAGACDAHRALVADNARLRAEVAESERARAALAGRVRELETLVAMYARGGAQA